MANSGARPWDVGDWLRSLGLGRYEADFSENAIDADILRDLTDQDLEKLGVVLGDRRRLLRAIAVLDHARLSARPVAIRVVAVCARHDNSASFLAGREGIQGDVGT
jgi:hypothetical protein